MSERCLTPWLRWRSLTAVAMLAVLLVGCGEDRPGTAVPGALPLEIHVRWEVDEAFPATITIHEPPPAQALYEMHTYATGEPAVVGEEIAGGVMWADYSEPRRFIARLQNQSDEDVRFWVAPHLPIPHVSEQGLMMFCLCTGEVYAVPAGGTWTRVMEFGVTPRAALEGPVALTHVIVRGELAVPTPVPAGDAR